MVRGSSEVDAAESSYDIYEQVIDNYDSGYVGMAVQLYVQVHLGHYHILTQMENSQKLMAQLRSTPHFT